MIAAAAAERILALRKAHPTSWMSVVYAFTFRANADGCRELSRQVVAEYRAQEHAQGAV